jgi:hypothetical protein
MRELVELLRELCYSYKVILFSLQPILSPGFPIINFHNGSGIIFEIGSLPSYYSIRSA